MAPGPPANVALHAWGRRSSTSQAHRARTLAEARLKAAAAGLG